MILLEQGKSSCSSATVAERIVSLTPKSTIVAGYLKFLNDRSLNGQLLECSRDKLIILKKPEYADGEFSQRTGTVYDPLFVAIHGEPSRQKEALNPQV